MAIQKRKPPKTPSPSPLTSQQSSTIPSSIDSTRPSTNPLLPAQKELLLLAIYPALLLLGSLYSRLSPTTTSSAHHPPSAAATSTIPPPPPSSYFASKTNLLNLYFVKLGWLWMTAALALVVGTHRSFRRAAHPVRAALRVAARYAAVSAVWLATTQWCFGPPLIDRSFVLSGGACYGAGLGGGLGGGGGGAASVGEVAQEIQGQSRAERLEVALEGVWTNVACRAQRGTWSGGVDISGHVFLLVLGSGMLGMEILPLVWRGFVWGGEREKEERMAVGQDSDGAEESMEGLGIKFAAVISVLSTWMLLMTAIFFHTWVEKLSGLIVAFFGLWLVYILPRGVPALRRIFGIPGQFVREN